MCDYLARACIFDGHMKIRIFFRETCAEEGEDTCTIALCGLAFILQENMCRRCFNKTERHAVAMWVIGEGGFDRAIEKTHYVCDGGLFGGLETIVVDFAGGVYVGQRDRGIIVLVFALAVNTEVGGVMCEFVYGVNCSQMGAESFDLFVRKMHDTAGGNVIGVGGIVDGDAM